MSFTPIEDLIEWWTWDDTIETLRRHWPSSVGRAALAVARGELGRGEYGGNNKGSDIDRYRGGQGGSGAWCAAFVSYCLEQGARNAGAREYVKRSHGARRLFRRCIAAGTRVDIDRIQEGDIVCWKRGPDDSWKGHIGIVSDAKRDNGKTVAWSYIAGNEGPYPARVMEHVGHTRRLVGFARLPI